MSPEMFRQLPELWFIGIVTFRGMTILIHLMFAAGVVRDAGMLRRGDAGWPDGLGLCYAVRRRLRRLPLLVNSSLDIAPGQSFVPRILIVQCLLLTR